MTRPGEPRQLNLPSVELKHVSSVDNKDVTTLDWHVSHFERKETKETQTNKAFFIYKIL